LKIKIADKPSEPATPLLDLMAESVPYQDIAIHIHSTVGYVASNQAKNQTALDLIQKADAALYHAQNRHLHSLEYEDEMEGDSLEAVKYLGHLRDAIENDELVLYYQPKINLHDSQPHGAEALVRWNSPTFGFVPPDMFIPQAEQTQLIHTLTRWIINEAFKTLSEWNAHELHPTLSINLATKNLQDDALLVFINDKLEEYNLKPQEIEFEITESSLMHDPEQAIEFMNALKKTGFKLSVDDYGSGYASLGYLKKLPVDALKIDMMFIKDITENKYSQEIVKSTLMMAHGLGLKVIAEGVENDEARQMLHDMGCDIGQGYYFAKPLPEDEIEAFLAAKTH